MKEFLDWLKTFFGGVAHVFFSFISQAIPLEKQIILNDLAPLAAQITADLDSTTMTWQEKRDAAFGQLEAAAIKLGYDVARSLISLAIELAVQNLRTQQTAGNAGILPGGNTNAQS